VAGTESGPGERIVVENAIHSARKTNEIYPDSSDTTSSGTDQVKLAYNIDGSLATRTGQRGTVIDYTYDNRRQSELAKVTTLGGSADGHVRAIKRAYDDMARVEKITSTANSDGTGTVRNEIQYEYNDFDQVAKSYQSHEGAVNTERGKRDILLSAHPHRSPVARGCEVAVPCTCHEFTAHPHIDLASTTGLDSRIRIHVAGVPDEPRCRAAAECQSAAECRVHRRR